VEAAIGIRGAGKTQQPSRTPTVFVPNQRVAASFFECEDDSTLAVTIVDPGNSVILRDKNNQASTWVKLWDGPIVDFVLLHATVGLATKGSGI